MSWHVLVCLGMSCVLECIVMSWNILECLGMTWNVLECLGMSWNSCLSFFVFATLCYVVECFLQFCLLLLLLCPIAASGVKQLSKFTLP